MAAKADKSWTVMQGVAVKEVSDLIDAHHGNLKGCGVLVVAKPKASVVQGRVVAVKAMKAPELLRAALAEHGEHVDYVLVVGADVWQDADPAVRRRYLDEALCYCAGKDDDGVPQMRPPDVSGGFVEIVQRYGVLPDQAAYVKAGAKQMRLDFEGPAKAA